MKRIHLLRVDAGAESYRELWQAAHAAGRRLGWLELEAAPGAPPGLEAAAAAGALRAVATGAGRVLSVKPVRGDVVLRDLLREHFRGCLAVLARGDVEAPRLVAEAGGWHVETGGRTLRFADAAALVTALGRPRPWD